MSEILGRETELQALADFLGRAATGHASLVVVGEPRIGKTVLLRARVARPSSAAWPR